MKSVLVLILWSLAIACVGSAEVPKTRNALASFLHSDEGSAWSTPFARRHRSELRESLKVPPIIPDKFYSTYFSHINEAEMVAVDPLYNVTPECLNELWQLDNITNLENVKSAIKMVDSSGKIPYGVLNGNLGDWGSYDECQTVPEAHFCLASAEIEIFGSINLPQLQWGFCVPAACNSSDVAQATYYITHLAQKNHFNLTLSGSVAFCEKSDSISDDRGALAFLGVVAMLGVAVIGCTILDLTIYAPECYEDDHVDIAVAPPRTPLRTSGGGGIHIQSTADAETPLLGQSPQHMTHHHRRHHHHHKGKRGSSSSGIDASVVSVLSLAQNAKRLFSVKVKCETEHLQALNGMRTLSMLWVILGHTHYFVLLGALDNRTVVQGTIDRFTFQVVANAFFAVDSFFFLSGFLVAYLTLNVIEKNHGKFPYIHYYIHRYWRLTPTLFFVLMMWWKLTAYFGSGPVWFAQQYPNSCGTYWWTNLLYVNNFVPVALGKSCLSWSWYLANDMQFFTITPVLLILLYKKPMYGHAAIAVTLVGSFVATALIVDHYHLNANVVQELLAPGAALGDYTSLIYSKPYCRIAPYLVGIVIAHLVRQHKPTTRPLGGLALAVGWLSAWMAMLVSIFAFYGQYHGNEWSNATNIIYTVFARFAWACALGWITWLCTTGQGGVVNQVLAAPLWQPFARLTYSAYLVHPMIITVITAQVRHPVHYDQISQAINFLGFSVMAYGVAAVVSLFIELPMSGMEKVLMLSRPAEPAHA